MLACFGVIALALGYWQVWRGPDLASDPADLHQGQPRGRILDRNGEILAESEGTTRRYAEPSLVHTVGFHSARFGDTDVEAAYDAELRGERSLSAGGCASVMMTTRA